MKEKLKRRPQKKQIPARTSEESIEKARGIAERCGIPLCDVYENAIDRLDNDLEKRRVS